MRSIRSRTLLLVLGLLAVALSAISYVSYRDARHEIEEVFAAVLAQQARLLAGMIPADMAPAARLALQQALVRIKLGFRPVHGGIRIQTWLVHARGHHGICVCTGGIAHGRPNAGLDTGGD